MPSVNFTPPLIASKAKRHDLVKNTGPSHPTGNARTGRPLLSRIRTLLPDSVRLPGPACKIRPKRSQSGLREGRAPNSVTLSFLPLTHQIIAVCVYSSRDHRSKIYRLYTDACYAPNRARRAIPALYARPGLSPAAPAYHDPPL
jgi:hypothetical protein